MAYSIYIKEKAENLRKRGFSLNEIHKETGVSKSVISDWVRNIDLSEFAKKRLLSKIKLGQFVSAERKKAKTEEKIKEYQKQALKELKDFKADKITAKIICSLLYWCEGGKNPFNGVQFTNSDSRLIKNFLYLFRKGFDINESKFRLCIHLHQYHNPQKQIDFWSETTAIPKGQFIKPFLKKNTGKRIKKDYSGCLSVRYHDNDIARQLLATGEIFLNRFGGIG